MEVALGLVPATFLLLPLLLAGGLGTAIAALASGAIEPAIVILIGWVVIGVLAIAALWLVVLSDGAVNRGRRVRFVLAAGLLLGIAAAARWFWTMGTSSHRYGAATWLVWLLLLGGPVLVASLRLKQLWRSL
jgi:hypothetical protein